jgi:mannose-6-phosphate isomerase-like protein (cupin superfamily)
VVKVAFGHTPGAYTGPNQIHWNLFDAIAACQPIGTHVDEAGLYASALGGYAQPNDADATCKGKPGYAAQAANALATPFDPKSTFGHMHGGKMEWWLIQSGIVVGRIENEGEFHAHEGDIMAAPQGTWHTMNLEGPGFSERLGIVPFAFNNENSVGGGD